MKPNTIEDRTIIAVFDVQSDTAVFERYNVTHANTVIIQNQTGEVVREKAFNTATQALAFAIEQTGWGTVVEHLPSWEALNA